jgi:prepilin-type N-terminal cleavage/methylation domain-containing protein
MMVNRSKRGFTLVEVMIAILLLVGGIAAATFVMGRGMFATTDTENVQQALALAQEKMESIRGTAFASIASESKAAVSGWSGFSREVTVSQPTGTNSDFKQVVVTVYWNTVDGELSTSLTTYVADVANN